MTDGTQVNVRLTKYGAASSIPTASDISGFTTFWEITIIGEASGSGKAKIILPYPDNLNQTSAQGRFITIEHGIVRNITVVGSEIFSNDATIRNRKTINLLPAGIEIEVDSFSPFYIKSSTEPENPVPANVNIPQTGDRGLSLGLLIVCLSAAFAGLLFFRNRKNVK